MNVLVIGGAGYIGSVFVPQLLIEGYKVTVLDNFLYKQDSLLDVSYHNDLLFKLADHPAVQWPWRLYSCRRTGGHHHGGKCIFKHHAQSAKNGGSGSSKR